MPLPNLRVSDTPSGPDALNPGLANALPAPPPGYKPGYTAPVRMQEEDSMWYKIGSVLNAANTPAGQLPASIKLKMAHQQAQLEESQNKLAWDNYYKTNETTKNTLHEHNKNSQLKAVEMLPHFKGVIDSISDPEQRTKISGVLSKIIDSYAPGLGEVTRSMDKTPWNVLGVDSVLADPHLGKEMRALTNNRSYEEVAKDPAVHKLVEVMGRDTLPMIVSRFPADKLTLLADGKMDEQAFRKHYDEAIYDASFAGAKPVDHAFAKSILNAPYAEEIMVGLGVNTNKQRVNLEKKEKPGSDDAIKQAKNQDIMRIDSELEDAQKNPSKYSSGYIAQLKEDKRVHIGLLQKQTNPAESLNTNFSRILYTETGNKFRTISEIDALPDGPERSAAIAAIPVAQKKHEEASAKAQMAMQMQKPADMTNRDVYSIKEMQKGKFEPVLKPMSEGELRTNNDLVKLSPDQVKKFTEFDVTKMSGNALFDQAEKTFKATSFMGRSAEAAAEMALGTFPFDTAVKAKYPEIAAYAAARESGLGKFARSVSGEVGVLTDQDAARARGMFPNGSDTPAIRKAKRKSFNNLIELNKKFATEIIAGKLDPAQAEALKASPKYRDKVNGIFGSIEGLSKSAQLETEIVPKVEGKDTRTRAERLIEEMRKGK